MTYRAVITGIGLVSALGSSTEELFSSILRGRSAVRTMDSWTEVEGLKTSLGAPLQGDVELSDFSPKLLRSTGKVAHYALVATKRALINAGLYEEREIFESGRVGVAYGSGFGSYSALKDCARFVSTRSTRGLGAGIYHKMMAHTCASHISLAFGVKGRLIPTSTACTSASQGIGYGYEAIRDGRQEIMLCGGAEELNEAIVAMFDILCACSLKTETAEYTPAPFDSERDGMVVGEGAGTVVVESLDSALRRGAPILAEIVGFATNSDAFHITNPHADTVALCFRKALSQSGLKPHCVGYINAHATGTRLGDSAEASATGEVYGPEVRISSAKGHLGHTLGACGALETALTVEVLRQQILFPTRNLRSVDPMCANLNHVVEPIHNADVEYAVNNTLAFGGINTSLIFRRWNGA